MSEPTTFFYEFGPFRIDTVKRLLLRGDEPVPLTSKAFDLLLVLVEHSGQVLEKDELMKQVWSGSIVEEANLSVNMSALRKALGETPVEHRYVVTIPGRGYRFVATVKQRRDEGAELIVQTQTRASVVIEEVEEDTCQSPRPSVIKTRRRRVVLALAALTLVSAAILARWHQLLREKPSQSPSRPALRLVPITSFPGQKNYPAFSPDGNQVAFVWDGGSGGAFHVYVKLLDTGKPLQLTASPCGYFKPAWSPDGRYIAFLRPSAESIGIYLIPSLGGAERKLCEVLPGLLPTSTAAPGLGPDWSPDGRWLAIADSRSPDEPRSIFMVSVETGEKHRLTSPPAVSASSAPQGDSIPAFSPDGKLLAFARGSSWMGNNLYVVPVAGGAPRCLTFDQRRIAGLAWTADNREIVFSSDRGGAFRLWKIAASGGTPEPLPSVGEDARYPAIARHGDRLTYAQDKQDSNIWRTVGPKAPDPDASPTKLIASTRLDIGPQYSPDGRKIVFVSDRSGSQEIWTCDSEGLNPVQLTFFSSASPGYPRWSPDGRWIVFDCILDGQADIYVINAEGGAPRRLTTEPSNDFLASWSRDGRWIYFGSNRSGSSQVWKSPAEGGQAVQITKRGGQGLPFESSDGKFLYYYKSESVWRMPMGGGEETLVLDHVLAGYSALLDEGICFLNRQATPRFTIEFFNFATRQTTRVATVEKDADIPSPRGFAVSPDGRWVLYKRVDQIENDLILVENFR